MTEETKAAHASTSVRPLELFFDLVFVFTITQVASVLGTAPTLAGLGQAAVLLVFIWWMYGGYAWLTNALDLDRTGPRLLLLSGTAGFFLMALTVPKAAEPGPWGVLFGASYLFVVLVHLFGFIGTSGHRGILRVGPLNVASALVVTAAGIAPPDTRPWLWAIAAVMVLLTPFITGVGEFTVKAGHFVERHGLAVIIVLGESITGVGAAAAGQDDIVVSIVGAVLALALSASMWWLYFGREERESEARLERIPANRRPRAAVLSFGYAYFLIVFGIAITAVGLEQAVEAFHHSSSGLPAALLPLGVCLFLVGLACFHHALSGEWQRSRLVTAFAAAAIIVPAAFWLNGAAALACACLVLLALIVWETRQERHRPPESAAPR